MFGNEEGKMAYNVPYRLIYDIKIYNTYKLTGKCTNK